MCSYRNTGGGLDPNGMASFNRPGPGQSDILRRGLEEVAVSGQRRSEVASDNVDRAK